MQNDCLAVAHYHLSLLPPPALLPSCPSTWQDHGQQQGDAALLGKGPAAVGGAGGAGGARGQAGAGGAGRGPPMWPLPLGVGLQHICC